jgi:hypothetical protein
VHSFRQEQASLTAEKLSNLTEQRKAMHEKMAALLDK